MVMTDALSDMDKLVSIKGLVIRATPIIPDMKEGEDPSHIALCEDRLILVSIFPLSRLQLRCTSRHRSWQNRRANRLPSRFLQTEEFHATHP